MASGIYPYQPLDGDKKEIRVLRPRRSMAWRKMGDRHFHKDELLQFEVATISLLQKPVTNFYAVSYAWGTNPQPAKAILDGRECNIPNSAEAALRGLLKAMAIANMDCIVPIWIDAVCINQSDLKEKSQQVAGMGKVFSSASSVLVWLGEDDGTTESAITTINALAEQCLQWTDGEYELEANDSLSAIEQRKLPYRREELRQDCDIRSLELLLRSKYFSRLWVFQEIVLARQILLFRGTNYIGWHQFSMATRWTYHILSDISRIEYRQTLQAQLLFIRTIHKLRRIGQRIRVGDLDDYFCTVITLRTTEPRDKIFALLGLIDDVDHADMSTGRPVLTADYDKALVDIYTEAFLLTMRASAQPLFALDQCQAMCVPSDVDSSWPSWVPQLHLGELIHAPSIRGVEAGRSRSACVDVHPSNSRILQVTGIVFDTCERLRRPPLELEQGPFIENDTDFQSTIYRHFAYIWHPAFVEQTGLLWSKEALLSLAQCLMGFVSSDVERQIMNFAAFLHESRKYCTGDVDPVLSLLVSDINSGGNFHLVAQELADRAGGVFSLFLTASGQFGLCGNHAEEGDMICVLYGAQQPYIMRKVGSVWKLGGTCRMLSVSNDDWARMLDEIEPQVFDIN